MLESRQVAACLGRLDTVVKYLNSNNVVLQGESSKRLAPPRSTKEGGGGGVWAVLV